MTAQAEMQVEVADILQEMLNRLDEYYTKNEQRPNPGKTQVCAVHLKNAKAKCKLKIQWRGTDLEPCENPKYHRVTLDDILISQKQC